MRLQSAIFDMDGTLLDSMYIWDDLGPGLLRRQGIQPAPDLAEKLKVMTLRQGAAYCKEEYRLPQSVDDIVRDIEAQVEDFYRSRVEAKPGVKKFLSLLKMEGVWMYVATATDRHLAEAALRHAGIDGYFRGCSPVRRWARGRRARRSMSGACGGYGPQSGTRWCLRTPSTPSRPPRPPGSGCAACTTTLPGRSRRRSAACPTIISAPLRKCLKRRRWNKK